MSAGVLTATWKVTLRGPRFGRHPNDGEERLSKEELAYLQDATGRFCELLRHPSKLARVISFDQIR